MRIIHVAFFAIAFPLATDTIAAQGQLPTVPVIVAQASSLEMFGLPTYYVGRTPPGWPSDLVPPGAKILGGGTVGDSSAMWLRTAVFAFSAGDPRASVRALVTSAGYAPHTQDFGRQQGGFVSTGMPDATPFTQYCKGASFVTFNTIDSATAPQVIALHFVDGEMARGNCQVRPDPMGQGARGFPVTVPTLVPPKGTVSFGGGYCGSGNSGSMESTLRTTLPVDSIAINYTAQLVAAGWKADAKPAFTDGIAVQRFTFKEGETPWVAALVVMKLGDSRREIRLQLASERE